MVENGGILVGCGDAFPASNVITGRVQHVLFVGVEDVLLQTIVSGRRC